MRDILNNKWVILILLVIIIISELFFFSKFFSYSFIYMDDVDTIICDSFKNIFLNPNNGIFITSIFDKLFGFYIPKEMNIHPSTFKSCYFNYIESFFIIAFTFILNSFFFIKKKFDFFYVLGFLFCSTTIFFIIQEQHQPHILFTYEGFFRMLLPSFLWIGAFYLLTDFDCISKIKKIFISSLIFLACISNEMVCVSLLIGTLLYFGLNLRKQKISNILYIISAILGLIVLIKTGTFLRKTNNFIFDTQFIIELFSDFVAYSKDYIKYVFVNHIFTILLIIIQSIFLIIKTKKDKKVLNTIKLISSFFIGTLCFFLMLKALGRTHYENGQYWTRHEDLHMIFSFMLYTFNLTLLKIILEFNLISKKIISVLLILLFGMFTFSNIRYYKDMLQFKVKPYKQKYYKIEKILKLAQIKDEIALFNINDVLIYQYLWPFFYEVEQIDEYKIYEQSPYIILINKFSEKENETPLKFMFVNDEEEKIAFKKNGGIFTEEELQNIDFNKLLDKDFILNNKK